MSDVFGKMRLIWTLARRGAWKGVWFFSKALLYGLTHVKCKQCGGHKGLSDSRNCNRCGLRNIYKNLFEEDYA